MEYHFQEIEKKWQAFWASKKTFRALNNDARPKYYVLDMFPYPSGAGLHVGHPLGYIASDIVSRYKRHKGFNVLHPMGYDSFGLPAEQYAIQTGQHPEKTTRENIARYREQLDKIGFSFDWEREVRTSDPSYYKWTQWIFIQLYHCWYNPRNQKAEKIETLIAIFEKEGFRGDDHDVLTGSIEEELKAFTPEEWKKFDEKKKHQVLMHFRLAYLGEAYVNWCPAMGTVLANDEVKDGVSERGGHPVERKLMKQWSLRITAYAQRLLDGLDTVDWSDSLKDAQRNWIGRSEGCSVYFDLSPNPSPKERGEKNISYNPTLKERGEKSPGYITTDPATYKALQQRMHDLRENLTPAENALWQALRREATGYHIRRQHVIDQYIVDFVCLRKKVVIEVDGDIHDYQKDEDELRTKRLKFLGYDVIRFRNEDVLKNTDSIASEIKKYLDNISLPFGEGQGGVIEVFTTRPDTIFGVTFVTLAPEHELVEQITTAEYKDKVNAYITFAKNRSERERMADVKHITGQFTGAYVIHPFSGAQIPVWIGDYVLAGYGTGAVMAVPGHDSRDHAFAKHFGLEIKEVVKAPADHDIQKESYDAKEGKCVNSDFLNGLEVKAAIKKAIEEIEKNNLGKHKVNYRLRDAVFGRQRYWGEPIPVYYKDDIAYTLPENELPLILPEVDKFLPTETGEPPLARAANWKYQGKYEYEHTTMPGWAGSSWYFLRYMDAHNDKELASKAAIDYWKQIDLYVGGAEHATGHLLYFRFWTQFLFDLGIIPFTEPAQKLVNQGMIQGVSEKIYRDIGQKKGNIFDTGLSYVFNGINRIICFPKSELLEFHSFYFSSDFLPDGHSIGKINVPIDFVSNRALDVLSISGTTLDHFRNAFYICRDCYFYQGSWYNFDAQKIDPPVIKFITSEPEVEKMSKSKLNVVSPDTNEFGRPGVIDIYGADSLRLYEMFLGPLTDHKPWDTKGIEGVYRFLRKTWRLFYTDKGEHVVVDTDPTKEEYKALHKCIKRVTEDIERMSFNTVVSQLMITVNELTDLKCHKKKILEQFIILVSPYAPHMAEELWEKLGHTESISTTAWPVFDEKYLVEDSFAYPVSFNGKTRFNLELSLSLTAQEIEKEVMTNEQTLKYLEGKTPKKVIVVPKRIVNVVV